MRRLKGYRTVLFHSLYGVPALLLAFADMTHAVDITPILAKLFKLDDIPFVLACIWCVAFLLRLDTNTGFGDREGPA